MIYLLIIAIVPYLSLGFAAIHFWREGDRVSATLYVALLVFWSYAIARCLPFLT